MKIARGFVHGNKSLSLKPKLGRSEINLKLVLKFDKKSCTLFYYLAPRPSEQLETLELFSIDIVVPVVLTGTLTVLILLQAVPCLSFHTQLALIPKGKKEVNLSRG